MRQPIPTPTGLRDFVIYAGSFVIVFSPNRVVGKLSGPSAALGAEGEEAQELRFDIFESESRVKDYHIHLNPTQDPTDKPVKLSDIPGAVTKGEPIYLLTQFFSQPELMREVLRMAGSQDLAKMVSDVEFVRAEREMMHLYTLSRQGA